MRDPVSCQISEIGKNDLYNNPYLQLCTMKVFFAIKGKRMCIQMTVSFSVIGLNFIIFWLDMPVESM